MGKIYFYIFGEVLTDRKDIHLNGFRCSLAEEYLNFGSKIVVEEPTKASIATFLVGVTCFAKSQVYLEE